MDNLHVLANLFAESSLHRTAYSALPDAPVLPVVTHRRPLHAVRAGVRAITPGRAHRRSDATPVCPAAV